MNNILNMNTEVTYKGIIQFDPIDKTRKHEKQNSWKKIALVLLDPDISEYYSWFLKKRYNIILNKPIRGSHISFINDSINDIQTGLGLPLNECEIVYNNVKNKWNNKEIEIILDVDTRSNAQHWWLNVSKNNREQLHNIRKEIGLETPFFGLHMSLGYVNEKYIDHSNYILKLINKYGKEFN